MTRNNYIPAEEAVIEYLKRTGPSFTADIVNCSDDHSPENLRQAIHSLKNKGVVYRVNEGGRGKPAKYDLVKPVK